MAMTANGAPAPGSRSEGQQRVALIGSGNWGSAIASIISGNVIRHSHLFHPTIRMYVYEEKVDGGRNLTDVINSQHENVKYLPGVQLGHNVVAVPDVREAAADADVLIFVLPHSFVPRTCEPLRGLVKPTACAISLIKGFGEQDGRFVLMSQVISGLLGIPCSVLMGANLANEVARGDFCESTIGCVDGGGRTTGRLLKHLFHTDNFMISVVPDVLTVEVCGALKNIVACAAGFATGLGLGDNTNAAVMRLGLVEMIRFCQLLHAAAGSQFRQETLFESCGVADLITTCFGGRNRRVSLEFARRKGAATMAQLEAELLAGQKLQGPQTAAEVHVLLTEKNLLHKFPLFVAVHLIATGEIPVQDLIPRLRSGQSATDDDQQQQQ